MATTEAAAQVIPALESSAPAADGQEEAPREPGPEAAEPGAAAAEAEKVEGEVQEEEEEECGFCLFMKAGGCKDVFVAWQECVEAAQEGTDLAERCHEVTSNLSKCMQAHADFYAPVLQVEQALKERTEADAKAAADAARGEPASDAEKEEAVQQQSDSPPPAAEEGKEETVAEKV